MSNLNSNKLSLQNDIKMILSNIIKLNFKDDTEIKNYEAIVSNIYEQSAEKGLADLIVTKEYLKDVYNDMVNPVVSSTVSPIEGDAVQFDGTYTTATTPEGKVAILVTTKDGQSKIVSVENDATAAQEAIKKMTGNINSGTSLISAPEPGQEQNDNQNTPPAPNPENNAQPTPPANNSEPVQPEVPEQPTDESNTQPEESNMEEEPTEDINQPEDNAETKKIDDVLDKANNLIEIIDDNLNIIPDMETMTKLITIKIAIEDKKSTIENSDPSDPQLDNVVDSLDKMLTEVETTAIDTINKNTPGENIETTPATDSEDEINNIEKSNETDNSNTEDINLENTENKDTVNESEIVSDDESNETENVEDEPENTEPSVKTLEKEPSDDAPTEDDIHDSLGDTGNTEDTEDMEDPTFDDVDNLDDSNNSEFEDKSEELPEDSSVGDYIRTEVEDIEELINKLYDLSEDPEEAEGIKSNLDEEINELKDIANDDSLSDITFNKDDVSDDDLNEIPENELDDTMDSSEEIPEEVPEEFSDETDESDSVPDEFNSSDETPEDEIPTELEDNEVTESSQPNGNNDLLGFDALFEDEVIDNNDNPYARVQHPEENGTGCDLMAVNASKLTDKDFSYKKKVAEKSACKKTMVDAVAKKFANKSYKIEDTNLLNELKDYNNKFDKKCKFAVKELKEFITDVRKAINKLDKKEKETREKFNKLDD